ncbi:kirola-like [Lycium barbarum]|uniref:kirola-like n=1 Tax=Lycium barbarum TaxID=112863 RepID=UPI00293F7731|nr:kirola-like [Lycium barbarum]
MAGEGQEEVVKVVVEDIDEEKRLVTFRAFEGHVVEQYKAFKATVHIENEGENNLVLWTIEYEKQNEDVPDPFSYLQLFLNVTKDIDAHHVNQ